MKEPEVDNRAPSVLHCVYREGLAGVFASQVLKPVRKLREAGIDVGLVTMQPVGEWLRREPRQRWRHQRAAVREALGHTGQKSMAFWRLPSPPARWRKIWDDERLFSAWHRRTGWRYDVMHCRGSAMACIALAARERNRRQRDQSIILDLRGVEHAEHLYAEGIREDMPIPERYQEQWNGIRARISEAAQGADAIICVSIAMADYLVSDFDVDRERLVVCPCAVDTETFTKTEAAGRRLRHELGIGDRLVVVYCGSTREWQLPEQSVRLFRRIQQCEPSAFLLVLTPQEQAMQHILGAAGVSPEDCYVTRVPHAQVPAFLAAGDVGMLLREPCLVNRVASPVKFAEYLAAGLPVLTTEAVDDYATLIERERVGRVLPYADLDQADQKPLAAFLRHVMEDRQAWRARSTRIACDHLSLDRHRRRVQALYQRLASGRDRTLGSCANEEVFHHYATRGDRSAK